MLVIRFFMNSINIIIDGRNDDVDDDGDVIRVNVAI